jgi:hypothetical protein
VKTAAVNKIAQLSAEQQRELVKTNGKVSDVEIATATNTVIKPNLKQVKDFITIKMAQAGQTESVIKFGNELLDYIDGNATKAANG